MSNFYWLWLLPAPKFIVILLDLILQAIFPALFLALARSRIKSV